MELVLYHLDSQPFTIAPVCDIQWDGHPEHIAYDHLARYLDLAMSRNAWFLGLGDYIDMMSPSNRESLRRAKLYDSTRRTIQDQGQAMADDLFERLLKPTTGRWLGMLEGHHHSELASGQTTDQYLAHRLQARFLGTSAIVGLRYQLHGHTHTYTIWCHHGEGSGATATAPLTKLERQAARWEGIDLFVMGHMSKLGWLPIERPQPSMPGRGQLSLRHRTIHLVAEGGWLKGYREFSREGETPRGTYVERRMLTPVALGAIMVTVTPRVVNRGGHTQRVREHAPDIRFDVVT